MATTTLTGTTGNDILNAPGSVTTLVAGLQGNDTITLILAGDEANAGAGNDSITISAQGGAKLQTIAGGSGDDSLFLLSGITSFGGSVNFNDGNDYFANTAAIQLAGASLGGNAGNDTLRLQGGMLNSTAGGGSGTDSIAVTGQITNSVVLGGGGRDTIVLAGAAASTLSTIQASDGHDIILATGDFAGSNSLVIAAGKGFDSLTFNSAQVASIAGGALNDTIVFGAAAGGGTIYGDGLGLTSGGSDGNDLITFTAAVQTAAWSIYGGGGGDTVLFQQATTSTALLVEGNDGNDLIGGTAASFANAVGSILGGAGNDTITLFDANTALIIDAGDGADSLYLGSAGAGTTLNGGNGSDTITLAWTAGSQTGLLAASVGTINGGAGIDSLFLADIISVTSGNTLVSANGGANTFTTLYGTQGNLVAADVGDKITLATTLALASTATNWGNGVNQLYIATALFIAASSVTAAITQGAGSIAVYDTNGVGNAGGDLVIGIYGGTAALTAVTYINILGGDSLIKTTLVAQSVTLNASNFGFSIAGAGAGTTGGLTITLT